MLNYDLNFGEGLALGDRLLAGLMVAAAVLAVAITALII
jgi:hypothetical protein